MTDKAPAPAVTTLGPAAAQHLVSAIAEAVAELQRLRRQYTKYLGLGSGPRPRLQSLT